MGSRTTPPCTLSFPHTHTHSHTHLVRGRGRRGQGQGQRQRGRQRPECTAQHCGGRRRVPLACKRQREGGGVQRTRFERGQGFVWRGEGAGFWGRRGSRDKKKTSGECQNIRQKKKKKKKKLYQPRAPACRERPAHAARDPHAHSHNVGERKEKKATWMHLWGGEGRV